MIKEVKNLIGRPNNANALEGFDIHCSNDTALRESLNIQNYGREESFLLLQSIVNLQGSVVLSRCTGNISRLVNVRTADRSEGILCNGNVFLRRIKVNLGYCNLAVKALQVRGQLLTYRKANLKPGRVWSWSGNDYWGTCRSWVAREAQRGSRLLSSRLEGWSGSFTRDTRSSLYGNWLSSRLHGWLSGWNDSSWNSLMNLVTQNLRLLHVSRLVATSGDQKNGSHNKLFHTFSELMLASTPIG